jgi:hypothetical protein
MKKKDPIQKNGPRSIQNDKNPTKNLKRYLSGSGSSSACANN